MLATGTLGAISALKKVVTQLLNVNISHKTKLDKISNQLNNIEKKLNLKVESSKDLQDSKDLNFKQVLKYLNKNFPIIIYYQTTDNKTFGKLISKNDDLSEWYDKRVTLITPSQLGLEENQLTEPSRDLDDGITSDTNVIVIDLID